MYALKTKQRGLTDITFTLVSIQRQPVVHGAVIHDDVIKSKASAICKQDCLGWEKKSWFNQGKNPRWCNCKTPVVLANNLLSCTSQAYVCSREIYSRCLKYSIINV